MYLDNEKKRMNDFESYINQCSAKIRALRTDFEHQDSLIKSLSPYELQPKNDNGNNIHAIILVHGLLDSPIVMHSMASALNKAGFFIRNLLLPGHGLKPEALFNVHYQQWLDCVNFAIESLPKNIKKVSLVGLSTGALLNLYIASQLDSNIESLVLVAPAIKLKNPLAHCLPILNCLTPVYPWLYHRAETDFAKYQSMPVNAAYQVYQLSHKLNKKIKNSPIPCPIFMVISQDDETVSTAAAVRFFKDKTDANSRGIIYANEALNCPSRLQVKKSCYPDKHILNFSHICMTNSPTHSHYGEKNIHQEKTIYLGALSSKNLLYYPLKRLTYNPDFSFMMDSIIHFLINKKDNN